MVYRIMERGYFGDIPRGDYTNDTLALTIAAQLEHECDYVTDFYVTVVGDDEEEDYT